MDAPTIHQTLRRGAKRLADAGTDTPLLDAEVLLRHVLGVDRTRLFVMYPDSMPREQEAAYDALIAQRVAGEPVAYLVGTREFMALPFRTTPDVLIPRPDTEPLVEWSLAWLRNRLDARVADIGTGSGAIAVSIAAHVPDTFRGSVLAIDLSESALAVAEENADSVLSGTRRARMQFLQGSLADPLQEPVDLLLANLPYLTPGQIAENPALDAEPRLALDGGADGLDLIRELIGDLPRVLAPGGAAGFEVDPSQISATERLLQNALPEARVEVIHDLSGRQRHVVAQHQIPG